MPITAPLLDGPRRAIALFTAILALGAPGCCGPSFRDVSEPEQVVQVPCEPYRVRLGAPVPFRIRLSTFPLSDHPSHALNVVTGPEVERVWLVPVALDDATFGADPDAVRRWNVMVSDREGREHHVAAVTAHAPDFLFIGTQETSVGQSSALAVCLDGFLPLLRPRRAFASMSLDLVLEKVHMTVRARQQVLAERRGSGPAPF